MKRLSDRHNAAFVVVNQVRFGSVCLWIERIGVSFSVGERDKLREGGGCVLASNVP